MSNVVQLAQEAQAQLETRTRDDGSRYICTKDGAPDWLTELIHKAHGDRLPDDYCYQFISDAIDAIAEEIGDEPADSLNCVEADMYTTDLTAWLHSRCDRVYYLTEAQEEFGPIGDGFQLLATAQRTERDEIGGSVLASLEALADEG